MDARQGTLDVNHSKGAADPAPDAPSARRLVVLDVLRGVAICGIVWLNVPAITHWTAGPSPVDDVLPWLDPALQGRFIGLFAALFGMSFAMVLGGASARHARPRLVLLRRLGFLLGLGLLHMLLQPGEVLTSYAVAGIVLLLPLSYLRWAWPAVVLGLLALVGATALHLDPQQNALGMMLLGYGGFRWGLARRLDHPGRSGRVAAAVLVALYAVVLVLQHQVVNEVVADVAYAFTWADFLAGVVGACTIAAVVAVLVQTRLRPVLVTAFAPLGRMALTNYIGATVLAATADLVRSAFAQGQVTSTGPDLLLAAGILVVQLPASAWWLARFRYGPLEWVWRCVTWWQVVPNRRRTEGRHARGQ